MYLYSIIIIIIILCQISGGFMLGKPHRIKYFSFTSLTVAVAHFNRRLKQDKVKLKRRVSNINFMT